MSTYISKLLRKNISWAQIVVFFFANLLGFTILLLSMQLYWDISPIFNANDSFIGSQYAVITKRVDASSSYLTNKTSFSEQDISDLKSQSFAVSVNAFTPSKFNVKASLGLPSAGIGMSTDLFFESVADNLIDVSTDSWSFDREQRMLPIIIPRYYLNLYNFGFAQSKNLPKLTEDMVSSITMQIYVSGNGMYEDFNGKIVGFSNRLNTILVPQEFMDYANSRYAEKNNINPSRLIVEVGGGKESEMVSYLSQKGYEVEGSGLDIGKSKHILFLVLSVVIVVGVCITVLSVYILILSVFLLIQKDRRKIENLFLIGFSTSKISQPYVLFVLALNVGVTLLSFGFVCLAKLSYSPVIDELGYSNVSSLMPLILCAVLLSALMFVVNYIIIRRRVSQSVKNK
ncbi:MAG: ABC transporter permease [Bacteroides sp.]|nr:ABC transporter permease [Bacteroides sp.]